MNCPRPLALALALLLGSTASARAQVIFTNLDSGFDTQSFSTLTAEQPNVAFPVDIGQESVPFNLERVNIPAQRTGGRASFVVEFAENATGGFEPGQVLGTSDEVAIRNTAASIRSAPFPTTIVSSPGTYWVWVRYVSGEAISWFANGEAITSTRAESLDGTTWTTAPDVPEGGMLLFAPEPESVLGQVAALGALATVARARRRARRPGTQRT